jgi:transposase-like protein
MSAGGHARPFYCPYCGEEDFVPYGDEPNRYLCSSCGRHYSVKFLGLDATGAASEASS